MSLPCLNKVILSYPILSLMCGLQMRVQKRRTKQRQTVRKLIEDQLGSDFDLPFAAQFANQCTVLISPLSAIITGAIYMLVSSLCYKTVNLCEFSPPNRTLIPERVQWMRTLSTVITYIALYKCFFANALLLFRMYQLKALKIKLSISLLWPLLRFRRRISCSSSSPGGILKRNTFLLLPLSASGYLDLTFILALTFTHFIYSAYIKQNKVSDLGQGPEERRTPPPPPPPPPRLF